MIIVYLCSTLLTTYKILKPRQKRRSLTVGKTFKKCIELVEEIFREGYRLQIPSTQVEKLIKVHVGADKRTIQKYMKMLTAKNPLGIIIYRIDIAAIEKYVSEHMKEKL